MKSIFNIYEGLFDDNLTVPNPADAILEYDADVESFNAIWNEVNPKNCKKLKYIKVSTTLVTNKDLKFDKDKAYLFKYRSTEGRTVLAVLDGIKKDIQDKWDLHLSSWGTCLILKGDKVERRDIRYDRLPPISKRVMNGIRTEIYEIPEEYHQKIEDYLIRTAKTANG